MPSRAAGACFLLMDFSSGGEAGKKNSHSTSGCTTIPFLHLPGLWDRWRDPAGAVIESCSILTTTPNSLLADIHDRMPVILRPENYDLWLDPGFKDLQRFWCRSTPRR
jgi:putative SOS response-associated peptidase YedK